MAQVVSESLKFNSRNRLLSSTQFQACYESGIRFYSRNFILFASNNSDSCNHWRLGLGVSKKVGNAVCRNRIKRVVREFFRLNQAKLTAPIDFVVVPKRHIDAKSLGLSDLRQELPAILIKAMNNKQLNPKQLNTGELS